MMKDDNQFLSWSRWISLGSVRIILILCIVACGAVFAVYFLSLATNGGTLNLSWTPNHESDLAGYNIYRTTTIGKQYSKLNTSLLRDANYRDTGLAYGVTYYYAVTAVDTAANESSLSDPASARITLPTSVSEDDARSGEDSLGISPLAMKFQLSQNYPNPFNPTTNIKYVIPTNEGRETQRTVLRIYDIQGKLVRTLVDEVQHPDAYLVQWDTRDSTGKKVATGIYFCQLISGQFEATKKLIVLK